MLKLLSSFNLAILLLSSPLECKIPVMEDIGQSENPIFYSVDHSFVTLSDFECSELSLHPNKEFLYRYMTQNGTIMDDKVDLGRYHLNLELYEIPLTLHPTRVECQQGLFESYRFFPSTETMSYWIVNFSDDIFLNYIDTHLYAQEEYIASCVPALYKVRRQLLEQNPNLLRIGENDVMTTQGCKIYGKPCIDTIIPRFNHSIYGNTFQHAEHEELSDLVTLVEQPYPVNIVSIVAPNCGLEKYGKTYEREDLQTIFKQAYMGMSAIKKIEPESAVTLETGNWGAGSFGNDAVVTILIQIIAAHAVGIDCLIFYPRENQTKYENAISIFQDWVLPMYEEEALRNLQDVVDFLHEHAELFHFVYGKSNLT